MFVEGFDWLSCSPKPQQIFPDLVTSLSQVVKFNLQDRTFCKSNFIQKKPVGFFSSWPVSQVDKKNGIWRRTNPQPVTLQDDPKKIDKLGRIKNSDWIKSCIRLKKGNIFGENCSLLCFGASYAAVKPLTCLFQG